MFDYLMTPFMGTTINFCLSMDSKRMAQPTAQTDSFFLVTLEPIKIFGRQKLRPTILFIVYLRRRNHRFHL